MAKRTKKTFTQFEVGDLIIYNGNFSKYSYYKYSHYKAVLEIVAIRDNNWVSCRVVEHKNTSSIGALFTIYPRGFEYIGKSYITFRNGERQDG